MKRKPAPPTHPVVRRLKRLRRSLLIMPAAVIPLYLSIRLMGDRVYPYGFLGLLALAGMFSICLALYVSMENLIRLNTDALRQAAPNEVLPFLTPQEVCNRPEVLSLWFDTVAKVGTDAYPTLSPAVRKHLTAWLNPRYGIPDEAAVAVLAATVRVRAPDLLPAVRKLVRTAENERVREAAREAADALAAEAERARTGETLLRASNQPAAPDTLLRAAQPAPDAGTDLLRAELRE